MAATADEMLDGVCPSFRFQPTKRELIEFYLLPQARGQDPFPGVVIEDDAAGSSLPWDLFERHGLGSEDEAYFLVRTSDAKKPGARQDRGCNGGVGTWKMQSSVEKGLRIGGEKIRCRRSNLNLHMGKGKSGGSVGWVMHEYTIVAPPCPSLVKICHIAFTGHGRKRKRVPDGQEDGQSEHASRRARLDVTAAAGCSGAGLDHDSGPVVHDTVSLPLLLTEDDVFPQSPLLGNSEFPSTASANAEQWPEFEQQVQSTPEQEAMMLQLMVQQSTIEEQQKLCAEELEFWSSIGVDVQSSNCVEQEFWSSKGDETNSLVPHIGDMAADYQDQQEFRSSEGVEVQSSKCSEQDPWSSKGVESHSLVGVESHSLVPQIGDMAGDYQDQQDLWSLSKSGVQSNCVVPDMAAGALGGVHWGGYCFTC